MNQEKENLNKYNRLEKMVKGIFVAVLVLFVWQIIVQTFAFVKLREYRVHHNQRTDKEFSLINPEVVKKNLNDVASEAKEKIEEYIKEEKSQGTVKNVGFYFRDLESGYGFGINEHDKFIPASLLKMPTMIAYYKLAEEDPTILTKELVYDESKNFNDLQTVKSGAGLIGGQKYTVEKLIEAAIIYSDNTANIVLVNNIDKEKYIKIFTEIGIEYPDSQIDESITPKVYTNLYRVLYNSTYLSKEHSQKALDLLVNAEFEGGLEAGLNGNTKVANKFGERVIKDKNGDEIIYFHDCGIVYARHPYAICVMTKGNDMQNLKSIVNEISGIVFKEFKY